MRFIEFLLESVKADTIAHKMFQKLTQAIQSKDKQLLSNNPSLDHITSFVNNIEKQLDQSNIPYLQWIINQYIKDPHFKFEDLYSINQLLIQYNTLKKRQNITINKDINQFQNISSLQHDIEKYSQQTGHNNSLTKTIYNAMVKQIQQGNAIWFHKQPNFNVYQPLNWDAAKAIRQAIIDQYGNDHKISLCVTYLDTSEHFTDYSLQGELFFILTDSTMYSFFFVNDQEDVKSEFADINNNHNKGEQFVIQHKQLISKIFTSQINNALQPGIMASSELALLLFGLNSVLNNPDLSNDLFMYSSYTDEQIISKFNNNQPSEKLIQSRQQFLDQEYKRKYDDV